MSFGPLEIGILLFVIFIILGPKRITAVFQSLTRGIKDFTAEFGQDKKKDDKMLGGGDKEDEDPDKRR
ncbi:MAG: twin-arginine translocase TatA/TatE family subunit [Actinomycetota bacterium]|jgi:sec-independent protein translocase protein TatA|nr:twin-arginine translocase TatA/TatE family subunit [Actinomycetota bacterium]